jgi:hypothetical protein
VACTRDTDTMPVFANAQAMVEKGLSGDGTYL